MHLSVAFICRYPYRLQSALIKSCSLFTHSDLVAMTISELGLLGRFSPSGVHVRVLCQTFYINFCLVKFVIEVWEMLGKIFDCWSIMPSDRKAVIDRDLCLEGTCITTRKEANSHFESYFINTNSLKKNEYKLKGWYRFGNYSKQILV